MLQGGEDWLFMSDHSAERIRRRKWDSRSSMLVRSVRGSFLKDIVLGFVVVLVEGLESWGWFVEGCVVWLDFEGGWGWFDDGLLLVVVF